MSKLRESFDPFKAGYNFFLCAELENTVHLNTFEWKHFQFHSYEACERYMKVEFIVLDRFRKNRTT